jgi:serine/threonine protein kinase
MTTDASRRPTPDPAGSGGEDRDRVGRPAATIAMAGGQGASAADQPAANLIAVHTPAPRGDPAAGHPAPGPVAEGPGALIGPYLLLEKLGEGGMGAVYQAEQQQPVRRQVALKLIKPGLGSAQVLARFEAERRALALMDHPNIARVLDAGTTADGRPYFVMERVHGVPITQYCDDQRLPLRQRLELFIPVCQAIQHAHQKGIIHRDIKPSNVLVTQYEGQPAPKVIDFGIAKAIDQGPAERTMLTQLGMIVGTLEYMSPEQAEMSDLGVDTRSDIYALGVLLYELLTGSTPLDHERLLATGYVETLKRIKEEEPPRPSARLGASAVRLAAIAALRKTEPRALTKRVRGELDWIVMKALEKDRTRRYETANGLARDIQRHLAGDTVEACPPSVGYRLGRLARKYRRPLAAAVGFVLLLVLGIVVSTREALRASRAERRERDASHRMQAERDRARLAMARQVAERLDGDLRRLAMVGQVLAATLAQRAEWTEADLEGWMRAVLGQDERIFGMALAFEPRRFDPAREDVCLYVFRGPRAIQRKDLLPPSYVPLYREWDWYAKPLRARRGLWSDPYVDTGGGEIPMVTYSAPIRRGEEVVGVLTLDLSVQYFEVLRDWLEELHLGAASYGAVIGATGLVISHPHPAYDFACLAAAGQGPRTIAPPRDGDASFAALVHRMQTDTIGSGTAVDPATGRTATFLFARVPSSGWTFLAAIQETAATPPP